MHPFQGGKVSPLMRHKAIRTLAYLHLISVALLVMECAREAAFPRAGSNKLLPQMWRKVKSRGGVLWVWAAETAGAIPLIVIASATMAVRRGRTNLFILIILSYRLIANK